MFEFVGNIFNDVHPIVVHFPIALLMVSFGLTVAARWKEEWHETSWLLLVLGGLATIPATISGFIAHEPYEELDVISVIEPHQLLGIVGTVFTIGILVWRWYSRSEGKDIGRGNIYLVIAFVGIVWLFLLGGTGGNLVYEYGINVRGVNPLLP